MENDRGNHQKFIGDIRRDIVGIYGMMGFIMCVYIYILYIYIYVYSHLVWIHRCDGHW